MMLGLGRRESEAAAMRSFGHGFFPVLGYEWRCQDSAGTLQVEVVGDEGAQECR